MHFHVCITCVRGQKTPVDRLLPHVPTNKEHRPLLRYRLRWVGNRGGPLSYVPPPKSRVSGSATSPASILTHTGFLFSPGAGGACGLTPLPPAPLSRACARIATSHGAKVANTAGRSGVVAAALSVYMPTGTLKILAPPVPKGRCFLCTP